MTLLKMTGEFCSLAYPSFRPQPQDEADDIFDSLNYLPRPRRLHDITIQSR